MKHTWLIILIGVAVVAVVITAVFVLSKKDFKFKDTSENLTYIEGKKKDMSWVTFVALSLMFLKNEQTGPIFKSLNIYTKELDDFLMFSNDKK